jgi:hypothetical protein
MVLLVEQERLFADELQVVSDSNTYGASLGDWTTKKSYNVTLSKQLIVFVKATFNVANLVFGAGRITVDGYSLWSTGGFSNQSITSPDIYILLAAGSHTFNFDMAIWSGVAGGSVSFIYIGQLNFNDALSVGPLDSGAVSIPAGVDTLLINQNVTIPAGRATPMGPIANYSLFIFVYAFDASASPTRQTHMKSSGESNDGGKINVKLFINDVQVNWGPRANDDADGNTSNPSYGRGSRGTYCYPMVAGQTFNIKVKAYDSVAATVQCYVRAFLCPWITCGADYQPVTLDFPQGSTFYVFLEPLYVDTVKYSKLGKVRFKSFGDSTDYYSTVSGTGILQHAYTFDPVAAAAIVWVVSCVDIVCISYVAADVK